MICRNVVQRFTQHAWLHDVKTPKRPAALMLISIHSNGRKEKNKYSESPRAELSHASWCSPPVVGPPARIPQRAILQVCIIHSTYGAEEKKKKKNQLGVKIVAGIPSDELHRVLDEKPPFLSELLGPPHGCCSGSLGCCGPLQRPDLHQDCDCTASSTRDNTLPPPRGQTSRRCSAGYLHTPGT